MDNAPILHRPGPTMTLPLGLGAVKNRRQAAPHRHGRYIPTPRRGGGSVLQIVRLEAVSCRLPVTEYAVKRRPLHQVAA
jgi:hypothetical protein